MVFGDDPSVYLQGSCPNLSASGPRTQEGQAMSALSRNALGEQEVGEQKEKLESQDLVTVLNLLAR